MLTRNPLGSIRRTALRTARRYSSVFSQEYSKQNMETTTWKCWGIWPASERLKWIDRMLGSVCKSTWNGQKLKFVQGRANAMMVDDDSYTFSVGIFISSKIWVSLYQWRMFPVELHLVFKVSTEMLVGTDPQDCCKLLAGKMFHNWRRIVGIFDTHNPLAYFGPFEWWFILRPNFQHFAVTFCTVRTVNPHGTVSESYWHVDCGA